MGTRTQAGLMSMVFVRENESQKRSFHSLKEVLMVADDALGPQVRVLDMMWADSFMEDTSVKEEISIRSTLGLGTLLRLLRFLPDSFTDQWLMNLYDLSFRSKDTLQTLSLCPDWQPSLFQFVSELVESMTSVGLRDGDQIQGEARSSSSAQLEMKSLEKRLDISLELYSSLLGHRLREGGDQVRTVVHRPQDEKGCFFHIQL